MQTSLSVELLKDSKIPRKFWSLDSSTYTGDPAALKLAKNYVKRFDRALEPTSGVGLFLTGKIASFKTFLATLILKSLMVNGYDVAYWTLETIYTARFKKDVSFEDLVTRDHCVVFDNVNLTHMSSTGGSVYVGTFRRAIQIRSDNSLPYIVCSSLEDDMFEAHYGQEIMNRLRTDLVRVECRSAIGHPKWEAQMLQRKAPFRKSYVK